MKRSAFVAALVAAASSGGAGAQTPGLTPIRLAGTASDDAAAVLYAMRAGFFRNAGLDVTYAHVNSGAATAAAVIGGAADIGKSSLVSIINAHAHGVDLKIVAAGVLFREDHPDVELVVAPDSPVRAAHDLNGKTISVPALNDSNTLATMSWLGVHGGDPKTVQFVEVPATAAVAALAQGRIAAATLVRPYLSRAVADGQVRIVANVFAAIAKEFLQTAWFTTAAYAAQHRDAVDRFGKVVLSAGAYANDHHAETAVALAAFSGVDVATITEADRGIYATSLEARQIQPLIDAAAKYNILPRRFDAAEMLLK